MRAHACPHAALLANLLTRHRLPPLSATSRLSSPVLSRYHPSPAATQPPVSTHIRPPAPRSCHPVAPTGTSSSPRPLTQLLRRTSRPISCDARKATPTHHATHSNTSLRSAASGASPVTTSSTPAATLSAAPGVGAPATALSGAKLPAFSPSFPNYRQNLSLTRPSSPAVAWRTLPAPTPPPARLPTPTKTTLARFGSGLTATSSTLVLRRRSQRGSVMLARRPTPCLGLGGRPPLDHLSSYPTPRPHPLIGVRPRSRHPVHRASPHPLPRTTACHHPSCLPPPPRICP